MLIKEVPEEFVNIDYTREQVLKATESLTMVRKSVYENYKERPEEMRVELMLRESQEYDRLYWEQ